MSMPPDDALLAQLRSEVEAKVRAELSSPAQQSLPLPLSSHHGAAGSLRGVPGSIGVLPAGSSASIGGAGRLVSNAVNPAQPQRGSTRSSSPSIGDVEIVAEGAEEKEAAARKVPTKWDTDKKRILILQAVCEKPFLAKFQKGAKLLAAWDALATSISTVPDFAFTGGVTGRGCRVKYKEMMAAHRREVKRGEFTSGVREGMDDATHEALNACMQHEDEAEENATKSKGEVAANEAAKRDRAEKVHALASKSSGSGVRRKRGASGSGSTSSTSNPFSDDEDASPPPKRRLLPVTVNLEDSVSSYFTNQVESDETKERKLAIAESAAATAARQAAAREADSKAIMKMLSAQTNDPEDKAKRLATADKEADAKVNESKSRIVEAKAKADEAKAKNERKAEESKAKAAESELQKKITLEMTAIMGKLADKL